MRCPCRKKSETRSYADCCQPYHCGARAAPTAEALMRSRYAAFALQDTVYLRATWHSTTRPAKFDFMAGQQWMLLRVLGALENGDTATVEFIARSRIAGRVNELHEVSHFQREDGCWRYLAGEFD